MAYISIIDLPELQVEQIKGKEYLLVTNSDLESNKLQMDNMTEYISEIVADLINSVMNNQNSLSILTTEKLLITNNKILLNYKCKGDIIYNKALIYNDLNSEYFIEYTCNSSIDGEFIEFNYNDNLNGKYAVVSYLAGEII